MRLLELYTSVQGEGRNVGLLTQFVRFAGCNLRCAGWPCDTPYAILPEIYTKEQTSVDHEELYRSIINNHLRTGAGNICLTGGEPLLQKSDDIDALATALVTYGFTVEMFSNGSFVYTPTMLQDISIVMDWKLKGSGEKVAFVDGGRFFRNREHNWVAMRESDRHTIKFTILDEDDLHQAHDTWDAHNMVEFPINVFIGPVWGKFEASEIVTFIQKNHLPWRLNLQTHKVIWHPDARRT